MKKLFYILAFIAAVSNFFVGSSFICSETSELSQKNQVEQESDSKQSDKEIVRVELVKTFQSNVQQHFEADLSFEFELPVEPALHLLTNLFDESLSLDKYYRTLFEIIISPNAP